MREQTQKEFSDTMGPTQEPRKDVRGESHAAGLGATVQMETNIRGEAFGEKNPGKNNLFTDYFIYLIMGTKIWVEV